MFTVDPDEPLASGCTFSAADGAAADGACAGLSTKLDNVSPSGSNCGLGNAGLDAGTGPEGLEAAGTRPGGGMKFAAGTKPGGGTNPGVVAEAGKGGGRKPGAF